MSLSSRKVLVIDNYDSFTWNLVALLRQGNAKVTVVNNDDRDWEKIELTDYQGVVLSPGPGSPSDAGNLLKIFSQCKDVLPVLGVCLGHQAIGETFGLNVVPARELCHGKAFYINHDGEGVYKGIPAKFKGMRYHSLAVSEPDENSVLIVSSRTPDGEIMGLRHKTLPVEGVQFHPDSIETVEGQQIINNWLSSI
ncbi:MAG: aminodeoxychorismate/anthranilate synthase component II [Ignavibacteria bacterium]|nr:aminodeoxychorismate/anthranilate synthase component II [Ignavibacteria bacterium]